MNIELSPRQSATVGVAITALSACVLLLVVFGLFLLFARFVAVFSSVFLPLFVAVILALVVRPIQQVFQERMRLPPTASVAAVFITILLPLVLFLWFFGALAVSQFGELLRKLPELNEQVQSFLATHWPQVEELWNQYGMSGRIQEFVSEEADSIWSAVRAMTQSAFSAGASAFRSVAAALSWFVLPVYLAFFLMTPPFPRRDWAELLPFLKEETRKDVVYLVREFINIIVSFFRGQLIVALGQGLLFAIGFALVGLQHGFIIGLLLGFLNIIPYLGSMLGLAIALPLAFFQDDGGPVRLGLVMGVFAIVQLIEGYYLTPRVMGERTGLHPLMIIVALFFWGTAFDGIAGMILAIPLTAFLVVFWRLVKAKYITEIV
ncbi:MAG: AI-2E family transporter [Acidobacteriota bacterium]|nr:MAG: AI-2E family transporter [Acidobacteriota bacterium]